MQWFLSKLTFIELSWAVLIFSSIEGDDPSDADYKISRGGEKKREGESERQERKHRWKGRERIIKRLTNQINLDDISLLLLSLVNKLKAWSIDGES